MIKSTPQKLIAQGTDWRFLNELKKGTESLSAASLNASRLVATAILTLALAGWAAAGTGSPGRQPCAAVEDRPRSRLHAHQSGRQTFCSQATAWQSGCHDLHLYGLRKHLPAAYRQVDFHPAASGRRFRNPSLLRCDFRGPPCGYAGGAETLRECTRSRPRQLGVPHRRSGANHRCGSSLRCVSTRGRLATISTTPSSLRSSIRAGRCAFSTWGYGFDPEEMLQDIRSLLREGRGR